MHSLHWYFLFFRPSTHLVLPRRPFRGTRDGLPILGIFGHKKPALEVDSLSGAS